MFRHMQAEFFAATWERKPCLYRALEQRTNYFSGLCDYKALLHVAEQAHGIRAIPHTAAITPQHPLDSHGRRDAMGS